MPACALGLTDVSTKQIDSSANHTVIVSTGGQVYSAGSRISGKAGKKTNTANIKEFKLVDSLSRYTVKQVCCNDSTTLCLTDDSQVIIMGGTVGHEPRILDKLAGI